MTPDLIRISLGLEHISDIIHDFEQAFEGAGLRPAQGWTPTWKKGLSDEASDGTLYAPKPSGTASKATNGTTNAATTRATTVSA